MAVNEEKGPEEDQNPDFQKSILGIPRDSGPSESLDGAQLQAPVQEPLSVESPAEPPKKEFLESEKPVATPSSPPSTMDAVKLFSENLVVGAPVVPASFPFSLLIEGRLQPEERERLMDLVSRENMGIREVDLEPQFSGGKILIPRISEYAGVLIVQALRGAAVQMKLGPSESIFSSEASEDSGSINLASSPQEATFRTYSLSDSHSHPAEALPITQDSALPGAPSYVVVDVVHASALLKTVLVEAETSQEYQEALEALQRELKYKAYRKKANAILNFTIQLTKLTLPTQYRLQLMGSAVRYSERGT